MELSGEITTVAYISIDDKDRTKCGTGVIGLCRHLDEGGFEQDMYCRLFGSIPCEIEKKDEHLTLYHSRRCQECIDTFGTGGE